MKSWVRENLKNLSRAGELGKRATESPIVLNGAHPEKSDNKNSRRSELQKQD